MFLSSLSSRSILVFKKWLAMAEAAEAAVAGVADADGEAAVVVEVSYQHTSITYIAQTNLVHPGYSGGNAAPIRNNRW
jgi:hypothetical protein